MRRIYPIFVLFVIWGLWWPGKAGAITVTATPGSARVGDTVNFNITATFSSGITSCTLQINYGDSASWFTLGTCTTTPCSFSTTHAYTSSGTYTIRVQHDPGSCDLAYPPDPPDPATTTVNITPALTVTVTLSPASLRVPRGESSLWHLVYNFRSSTAAPVTLTSSRGYFRLGATTLGTVPRSLSVTLRGGRAVLTENLTVPVAVLERALRRGATLITYERTFTGPVTVSTRLPIRIVTEATGGLRIRRLELYFENRRAEITVPRHFRDLRAYARLRYSGSDLLRGYWEVDGRVLSYVQRHLTYSGELVLESPRIPPLPTYEPGTHLVRFVIEDPPPAFELPTILYFVTTGESRVLTLRLISPANGTSLTSEAPEFRWEGLNRTSLYLVQFFESPDKPPVFSAYTRSTSYRLPQPVLRRFFSPGKRYFWRVSGFDSARSLVAESPIWSFRLPVEKTYVPGEILLAFRSRRFSSGLLRALTERYRLSEIRNFSLEALRLRVFLLRTPDPRADIPALVRSLSREGGVFLAQPNFVFRTRSEPLRARQAILDLLGVDELHRRYLGQGVLVAVVDTGVDFRHRDLRDRVRLHLNFVPKEGYRPEIHGTAVAGVIAASINDFGIEGLAPEAELLALRACRELVPGEPPGECYSETLARALDRAITEGAEIVNLSLGGRVRDPLLSRLIEKAAARGILLVAPAGEKEPLFPASHPAVLAVGMRTDSEADIIAPGEKILTTFPGDRFNFLSGSSMAAAATSGLLALALEKYRGHLPREKMAPLPGSLCALENRLFRSGLCREDTLLNLSAGKRH
ncbi:S8 family serine peptidase [Thermosulfurimonas sp. F29]|uniref:S8 family serine peptidase n=1 Tax=Thermosulfurimonas sp. F29 TaxID=2867247 RepID=UPI001C840A4B|nr:S8 family serine peptidase [Thermosulfurimonas sp. F29]MBX6423523.1 S8 family serine peptidase [Thermosulfurimonas sp. F29]